MKCHCKDFYESSLMDSFNGVLTCKNCGAKHYPKKEVPTTQHLYTSADVKKVREKLLKEQGHKDLLTGLKLEPKDAVCDHSHKNQYVRGILHRQSNAVLGKIENLWTRYLAYWYKGTLQEFLRKTADYLDREIDTRYLHPGFIKRLEVEFNKLNEAGKREVLHKLDVEDGKNATERKAKFKKEILSRKHTYENLLALIKALQERE